MTLSLCMIVKNEASVLSRCLSSIRPAADEIIVADTGSTDHTKEIARSFGARVYDFPWCDDFSAARNFAVSKATMDYWMWLDADDVLPASQLCALLELKEQLCGDIDIVMMKYETSFDEQGKPLFSFYRERILKTSRRYIWEGPVHEAVTPSGALLYSPIAIWHKKTHVKDSDRNLNIYEKWIQTGRPLSARHQFYYGRELYDHSQYEKAALQFEQFLSRPDGWSVNKLDACRLLSCCCREKGDEQKALQSLLPPLHMIYQVQKFFAILAHGFSATEKFPRPSFGTRRRCTVQRTRQMEGFFSMNATDIFPASGCASAMTDLGNTKKLPFTMKKPECISHTEPSIKKTGFTFRLFIISHNRRRKLYVF